LSGFRGGLGGTKPKKPVAEGESREGSSKKDNAYLGVKKKKKKLWSKKKAGQKVVQHGRGEKKPSPCDGPWPISKNLGSKTGRVLKARHEREQIMFTGVSGDSSQAVRAQSQMNRKRESNFWEGPNGGKKKTKDIRNSSYRCETVKLKKKSVRHNGKNKGEISGGKKRKEGAKRKGRITGKRAAFSERQGDIFNCTKAGGESQNEKNATKKLANNRKRNAWNRRDKGEIGGTFGRGVGGEGVVTKLQYKNPKKKRRTIRLPQENGGKNKRKKVRPKTGRKNEKSKAVKL